MGTINTATQGAAEGLAEAVRRAAMNLKPVADGGLNVDTITEPRATEIDTAVNAATAAAVAAGYAPGIPPTSAVVGDGEVLGIGDSTYTFTVVGGAITAIDVVVTP